MSSPPDGIAVGRDSEPLHTGGTPWIRRVLLGLVACLPIAALFNVFGQRPSTSHAASPVASLSVRAPDRLRGGLLFMARFHLAARTTLKRPVLVLDPGWIDGMQVNSINPDPVAQGSREGRLVFQFGGVRGGRSVDYRFEFQVDPTTVGRRSQNVELDDGPTRLLTIGRAVTIFP